MMQKSVRTTTNAGDVGLIMMADCGASVVRREKAMNGQMTIFDFPEVLPSDMARCLHSQDTQIIERRELLKGSGFKDGKKRIRIFFAENTDSKSRIEFLKNEYGVGGWSIPEGWVSYDARGIDFDYKPTEKYEVGQVTGTHIGWQMVAVYIDKLIKEGVYSI